MKIKKLPKFIERLLTTTEADQKVPNNENLDAYILKLKDYMKHVYPLTLYIIRKKTINTFKYKWVTLVRRLVVVGMFIGLCYTSYQLYLKPTEAEIIEGKVKIIYKESPTIAKTNLEFMQALSLLESQGNYTQIGGFNNSYWGAYQFGKDALESVGLKNMSMEMFLTNPVIQDWAMNEYMKYNYKVLKQYIDKYNIPQKGGVRIGHNLVTVSGLIAAAHLGGARNVIKFLESNGNNVFKDGFGTLITHYFQLNNYELEFDKE